MPVIGPIFEALANFFKWRAVEAQIRAQKVALLELEALDKECDEYDKEIDDLRRHNRDVDADRLQLKRSLRAGLRAQWATALPVSQAGGNLQSPR